MLTYFALLFIFIICYSFCDATMDSIKDLRTHKGDHPYRDFWHLLKHFSRLFLIGVGVVSTLFFVKTEAVLFYAIFIYLFVMVVSITLGLLSWDYHYKNCKEFNYHLDEYVVRIDLKNEWLNKLMGFHH